MGTRRFGLATLIAALVLGAAGSARASWITFTLDPSHRAGPVGSNVTFYGTLTNNCENDSAYLEAIFVSVLGDNTADDTAFFTQVPFPLTPLESYYGPIFDVSLNAQGTYSGMAILSGTTSRDGLFYTFQPDVSADFTVTGTPEPSTWALLGTGLAYAGVRRRWARRRLRIARPEA